METKKSLENHGKLLKAVALIGNCSNCGEAVEILLSKEGAKKLVKQFKGESNKKLACTPVKCLSCGKDTILDISKREAKGIYKAFSAGSSQEAEKQAETSLDVHRNLKQGGFKNH